ncbi:phosphoenolpyruvate carboxykinase [Microaceticoccus formicicus]|uniref:phosphoenolpyruvate carboxykinase n=1 Tax=Microaceticoccus formicicus TaxID=3118105 RepID=UPI003CD0338B|nr:phosphoenolpyruvate carboxykinase [Peptoniphilaceae bacterium AMB_02]
MKKEWALSKNKVLINFSQRYCDTEETVLNSEGFRSVLEHYLRYAEKRESRSYKFIVELLKERDLDKLISKITQLCKLLVVMDVREINNGFDEFENVYSNREKLRKFVEEVYTYWRNLERYAIVHDVKITDGILNTSFMEAKEKFDKLMITLYRKITNNISLTTPTVYRQVPAGANVGMIVYDAIWPVPKGYEILQDIPFIKEIVLQSPFITYPKKNTRDGYFDELEINPLRRCGINADRFFCYPAKVGNLLAYVFIERDYLTHGVSLANLFELPKDYEISGCKPNLLLVFGAEDHRDEVVSGFFEDKDNEILVGYVSADEKHDYFGYMKKMILTLHNLYQIRKGNLPIHGAMVHIELKDGSKANVVIVGDSGAGKSESIEAFRGLANEYISDMTIIFDDMGTFVLERNVIKGYGTEIGAFVRLDDLEAGYAFKELDRSIFMNPDRINARLITPVATYEEISKGHPIDLLLYANNYDAKDENESAVSIFDDETDAKDLFVAGMRMAKGTTTENGLTSSFFANPFGPHQRKKETLKLIDKYFDVLFENNIPIGVLNTQLGIVGMEKEGPRRAAIDLFETIKKYNRK